MTVSGSSRVLHHLLLLLQLSVLVKGLHVPTLSSIKSCARAIQRGGAPSALAVAQSSGPNKLYRQRVRPKNKVYAPLVDSSLLRFLSKQKQKSKVPGRQSTKNNSPTTTTTTTTTNGIADRNGAQPPQDVTIPYVSTEYNNNYSSQTIQAEISTSKSTTTTTNTDTTSQPYSASTSTPHVSKQSQSLQHIQQEEEQQQQQTFTTSTTNPAETTATSTSTTNSAYAATTPPTSSTTSISSSSSTTSWLLQFNSHVVSKKLTAAGATLEAANKAGDAVQTYALAKNTRQQIRKFLRERDQKWAKRMSSVSNARSSNCEDGDVVGVGGGGGSNGTGANGEEECLVSDVIGRKTNKVDFNQVVTTMVDSGLTGNDIAAILTHTPSVSMMTTRDVSDGDTNDDGRDVSLSTMDDPNMESSDLVTLNDTLERAYFGLLSDTLKLRKYDARKVLRTCPGLLTKRGAKTAEEVVTILSCLSVSPTSLCRDKAALPVLLSRSPAALFRFVAFLSGSNVRMQLENIGPLLRRSECASLLDVVAPLSPQLNMMNMMNGNGYNGSLLDEFSIERYLVSDNVRVEKDIQKTYTQMAQTASFLRQEVGILDLGKLLAAFPTVLMMDVKSQVQPMTEFLVSVLDIDAEDIPKIYESFPLLLGTPVDEVEGVVDYLKSLGVEEDVVGSIIRAFPALLTVDVETRMVKVVEFLESVGVTNIGRFITRLPPVLGYSVEDELKPKWNYLDKLCYNAKFEISRFPAYFSYPLERVIMNRYEYMVEVKGLPVHILPVDEVLRYGDKDFAMRVALDTDEGVEFLAYLSDRNKRKNRKQSSKKKKKRYTPRNQRTRSTTSDARSSKSQETFEMGAKRLR